MPKRTTIFRTFAAFAILAVTIVLFFRYYAQHPEVRQQLQATSIPLLVGLLFLYILFVGSLAMINSATLRLTNTRLDTNESILLTIYSSIINFFGPLQSGPAFRAVYLKKKHGTLLKKYTAATLLYYAFYALFSGLFLAAGVVGSWTLPVGVLGSLIFWRLLRQNNFIPPRIRALELNKWRFLAFATLTQVSLLAIIYFVELRSIIPTVSVDQVLAYTGAANFALFVSITPGAIGFRESFLLISEKLHHIPQEAVILANTIDRAIYITLLLLLAIGLFSSHAHKRFINTK